MLPQRRETHYCLPPLCNTKGSRHTNNSASSQAHLAPAKPEDGPTLIPRTQHQVGGQQQVKQEELRRYRQVPQQDADADTHLLRTALVADCVVLDRGELRQRPCRPGPRSLLICPMCAMLHELFGRQSPTGHGSALDSLSVRCDAFTIF